MRKLPPGIHTMPAVCILCGTGLPSLSSRIAPPVRRSPLTGDRVLSPGRVSDVSASQALGCIRLLRRGVASIDVGQSYVAVCFDFAPRAAVHDGVGVRLAAVDLDYSATALPDNGGPTPCNVPPRIRTTSADLFSDEGRCVPI